MRVIRPARQLVDAAAAVKLAAAVKQLEQEERAPTPPPSPRSRASSGRGASPSLIKPPTAEAKARLRKDAARMGWPPPAP